MPTCLHGWGSDGMNPSRCPQCDALGRERDRAELAALRAEIATLRSKPAISPSNWRAVIAAAKALKVAGPWQNVTDHWWQRFAISTSCRIEAVTSVNKVLAGWSGTICNGPVRIDALSTIEAAKAAADAALVADGWILADEETVST
jgi:hypothetical protein